MRDWTVRRFKPWCVNEMALLHSLERDCHGHNRDALDGFLAWAARARSVGYVAVRGETIVGYVLAVREPGVGRLRLLDLAVHPRHRLRGIGSALVRCCERLARTKGLMPVANVDEYATGCHLLLRSIGWRALEVIRRWQRPHDLYHFVPASFAAQCRERC